MLPQAAKLKREALDLLFPKWCIVCGRDGDFIFSSYLELLPWFIPRLYPQRGRSQPENSLCPNCARWQAIIDVIRAPFNFEWLLYTTINQLKYRNFRALSETPAGFLSDYLTASPLPLAVLVPAPIDGQRPKERGYSQFILLAHELTKITDLLLVADCFIRKRPAPPQVMTGTVAERRSNVAWAFVCHHQMLANESVLLIDYMATSKANLYACAVALEDTGASLVCELTLAK